MDDLQSRPEFRAFAPQGPAHVTRLARPDRVRALGTLLFDRVVGLDAGIAGLAKELRDRPPDDHPGGWADGRLRGYLVTMR